MCVCVYCKYVRICVRIYFWRLYCFGWNNPQMKVPLIISNDYSRNIPRYIHARAAKDTHTHTQTYMFICVCAMWDSKLYFTMAQRSLVVGRTPLSFLYIFPFMFPFGVVATTDWPRKEQTRFCVVLMTTEWRKWWILIRRLIPSPSNGLQDARRDAD